MNPMIDAFLVSFLLLLLLRYIYRYIHGWYIAGNGHHRTRSENFEENEKNADLEKMNYASFFYSHVLLF